MSYLLDRELFGDEPEFEDDLEWFDEHEDELLEADLELENFLGSTFDKIQDTLRRGKDYLAVRREILSGNRDENKLTNMVFFARHPERQGQKIKKGEPNYQQLSQEWLDIRNRLVQPALDALAKSGAGLSGANKITYEVLPGQEYGPRWRSQRPPGLPISARQTSRKGAALTYIEQVARQQNLGETFVNTVKHLAHTESGAMFARPADNQVRPFNVLPPSQRGGKPYISAWGAFQFNRDAWRSLPGVAKTAFPWDSTAYEEIARPVQRYAQLFSEVLSAGGTQIEAARGIRLWHITPAGYRRYLRDGRQQGFSAAWQQVDSKRRVRIDNHLRNAGVV